MSFPANYYTNSPNYPIQAAATDLQMLAIQKVHAALLNQGLSAHLVNFYTRQASAGGP